MVSHEATFIDKAMYFSLLCVVDLYAIRAISNPPIVIALTNKHPYQKL